MIRKIDKPQVGLIIMPIATQHKWYTPKVMHAISGNLLQEYIVLSHFLQNFSEMIVTTKHSTAITERVT